MGSFATYGMAGIGIAAAIGFVFALSMLSTNTATNANYAKVQVESGDQQSDSSQSLSMEQQNASEPSSANQAVDSADSSSPAKSTELTIRQEDLSIIALSDAREVIGEVESGMQFAMNEPLLIQAKVANPSEVMMQDSFIALAIKNGSYDESATGYVLQEDEELTSFRGDLAASSSIELELYWNPQRAGTYTIVLFSGDSLEPVATIPIEVADASST